MKQMVICGGWNKESLATTYILQQDTAEGKARYKFIKQGDAGAISTLAKPDSFSFNGAIKHDTENDSFILCSNEYIHVYKENEKKFEIIRKLD